MFNKLKYVPTYICIIVTMAVTQLPAAAQSRSAPATNPAPGGAVSTSVVPQAADNFPPEERIARLEERVNLALTLKDERIQNISERSENAYKLLQYVGVFAAAALAFLSMRDILIRWKEAQRQLASSSQQFELVKNLSDAINVVH